MLALSTRIPAIMTRSLSGSLVPSAISLLSHLTQTERPIRAGQTSSDTEPILAPFRKNSTASLPRTGRCSGSQPVTPGTLVLFGLKNTEKIVGPSVLRYAMSRNFYSISKTKTDEPAPATLREPHGSVIRELEPAFRRAGLIKVYEGRFSVRFSFGKNQFLDVVPAQNLQLIQLYFIDANGVRHVLDNLMSQFEPDAFAKHWSYLSTIYEKFGVDEESTPEATRVQGLNLYSLLRCGHAIRFLESNKEALADLAPVF